MTETNGFELLREERIAELNSLARLYRHTRTGAELLSLINDDENKVFGITFRTPPPDSTGVAHIMEHSVLCGSRKYPVKEPFVELIKGSLNTFLNAMTFPDKTVYPVASQNLQDFYNLVDVYLDSVFYPLLSPYTLDQEGWHYELDDPHQPMTFKGVVFNEMKGAYSEPENVLGEQVMHSLYPNTLYAYDSGGNPAVIPNLTYQEFKGFHDLYYHPSNARIFFYGDDDPDRRLELVGEFLQDFVAVPVQSEIPLQPPLNNPRALDVPYEVEENQDNAKNFVTVNWLLPQVGDPELTLGFEVLAHALIGTPAAQLRKTLIDSGLGDDLTGSGLETGLRQMFFSTGLKGVDPENVERVEQLIHETLQTLALNGLDADNLKASLNTLEFRLRENNTGGYPRGLVVMLRALDNWLYDKDPLAPLAFEEPLQAIKDRLAAGEPYFEHLIEAYLVNNTHRSTVVLHPDVALAEQRAAAERERLEQARAKMSAAELQAVIENVRTLKRRQETPDPLEALATIPMLKHADLNPEIRQIPSEMITEQGAPVLFHDLFTNGIFYLDLGFDMHVLPQELLPYVPLFGRALLATGTKDLSFVQLVQRIGQNTGGIRPSTLISASRNTGQTVARFILRAKAMTGQAGELLSILSDVLSGARLEDKERFKQMALEERAGLEARIVNAGHAIVNSRLKAHFDESGWASEQMGGVAYLFFLRDLLPRIDADWPGVLANLQLIRDLMLNRANAMANVTLDAAAFEQTRPLLADFLGSLPTGEAPRATWTIPHQPASEGLTIPAMVNYVGKGADLYRLGYQLDGSSFVVTRFLQGTWLWDKVRVQGGAYGGFCAFDSQSGALNFLSYRDPNLLETLKNFDDSAQFLKSLDLNEAELTKAIIGTIGDLDAYLLPDAKGYTAMRWFLLGTTDAERQKLRDEVLSTTPADFRDFAPVLEKLNQNAAVAVLGQAEVIEAAGVLEEVKKVL